MKISYYVSGHGLGHASRSCQVINTLRRRHPEIVVEVVSSAPAWFFAGALDPTVTVRRLRLDLGVLQRDSLEMREEETLAAYPPFRAGLTPVIAEEARKLVRDQVTLVVADIPPAAFAIAAAANLPSVGIANFSWDWIYAELARRYPAHTEAPALAAADYRHAELLLRLPFHGEFPAFDRIEDLPLVARRATLPPAVVRDRLGLAPGRRLGLISFGGFGVKDVHFERLAELSDWLFLTEADLVGTAPNLRTIVPGTFAYPDLVGAADAVISKPGYGIVSECLANGTALLYTSRGDFPEQARLVAGLKRYGRGREIDNGMLRQGRWGEALEELLALPLSPAEDLACDGDRVAADRLAALAGVRP